VEPYREEIEAFLRVRREDSDLGWKTLGERLSGKEITDFRMDQYRDEYRQSGDKDDTVLGRFFAAAIRQKQLVTLRMSEAGNHIVKVRKKKARREGGTV